MITRFPPSPTGPLHLGTARTALFNYLFAKKNNGQIIFRWEDTDRARSEKKFETEILEGLKWLGLDFEKEAKAIHRQTENTDHHEKELQKLWHENKIFPCFTTKEELDVLRQEAAEKKQNFVFWSPSRDAETSDLEKKMKSGVSYVWRLRVPKDQEITFQDLVRGEIKVNTKTLGDFVIARNDGSVLYPLANVLDDIAQDITHILRGEDGLPNTPKQILLFQALSANIPSYGHIPLVLDQKKRKLSKRNVDPNICVLISDFQKAGFIPEGVLNGLAFLGWNPKTTEEIFSLNQLQEIFELKHINPAAAQYDFEKMQWFNAKWLKKLEIQDLIIRYNNFTNNNCDSKNSQIQKAFQEAREKAKTIPDITPELAYLIQDPNIDTTKLLSEKMKIDTKLAIKVLENIYNMLTDIPEKNFNQEEIKAQSIKQIAKLELKNGQYLWPFRVALSNNERSSPPFNIAEIIEKTESLKRIKRARDQLAISN